MGVGSDCCRVKVKEYKNPNEEEQNNYNEPSYPNKSSNDEDKIHFRKIIYGQNRSND